MRSSSRTRTRRSTRSARDYRATSVGAPATRASSRRCRSRPSLSAPRRKGVHMSTQTIELSTADGPMDVYEATPDGGQPKGAIIVIQEAFGVNDHIEDVARRFADEGYH